MVHAQPFASGRDADLFELDGERVLRRYRAGGDVTVEAAVMRHLANHNFPVPSVYEASGADLVMDRLAGSTMLDAIRAGRLDERASGAILADLHDRLHLVPARQSLDPTVRILHMDLHPGNVMMVEDAPVVIDWRNTIEGDPDLDVAMSALILAEVGISSVRVAGSARAVLNSFLVRVHAEPTTMLDDAVVLRRRDPNLSSDELRQLDEAASLVRKLASRHST